MKTFFLLSLLFLFSFSSSQADTLVSLAQRALVAQIQLSLNEIQNLQRQPLDESTKQKLELERSKIDRLFPIQPTTDVIHLIFKSLTPNQIDLITQLKIEKISRNLLNEYWRKTAYELVLNDTRTISRELNELGKKTYLRHVRISAGPYLESQMVPLDLSPLRNLKLNSLGIKKPFYVLRRGLEQLPPSKLRSLRLADSDVDHIDYFGDRFRNLRDLYFEKPVQIFESNLRSFENLRHLKLVLKTRPRRNGEILSTLPQIPQLKQLSLSCAKTKHNGCSIDLKPIFFLRQLTSLSLSGFALTEKTLFPLVDHPILTQIHLNSNHIEGKMAFVVFVSMPRLAELHIRNSPSITNSDLNLLYSQPQFVSLSFVSTGVNELALPLLSTLPNLQSISIHPEHTIVEPDSLAREFARKAPEKRKPHENLWNLDLSILNTAVDLRTLATQFPEVTRLRLISPALTDAQTEDLGLFSKLRSLRLSFPLGPKTGEKLARLRDFKELDLQSTPSPDGLEAIAESQSLRYILVPSPTFPTPSDGTPSETQDAWKKVVKMSSLAKLTLRLQGNLPQGLFSLFAKEPHSSVRTLQLSAFNYPEEVKAKVKETLSESPLEQLRFANSASEDEEMNVNLDTVRAKKRNYQSNPELKPAYPIRRVRTANEVPHQTLNLISNPEWAPIDVTPSNESLPFDILENVPRAWTMSNENLNSIQNELEH